MSSHGIEEWEKETAEVEIRQWLYRTGQWAPEAAQAVVEDAEEVSDTVAPEAPAEVAPAIAPEIAPAEEAAAPPRPWYARLWSWLGGT